MPEVDIISGSVSVFLRGGPPTLPQTFCIADAVVADSSRLVIAHRGRNEHFAFTGKFKNLEGTAMPVAEWGYSTAIAE
ncbi:DUF5988 family protein [Streptomyces sp. MST-110588]|uniref:DUF5988 family protein n=1 Tax=Streptomyces sp. MST-110588 TaxID=2833628 RepID=UPI001F5CADAF|nr:DUF5988 family protein [Streptomyces sp. MST-110588]UNO39521.1 hypothetical protein KGS77_07785 [Streptomyces sp. MST-110588]